MRYYGFVPSGKHYAETIADKPTVESRSVVVPTGATYPTFAAAERAVFAKNQRIAEHADTLRGMACMDDEACPIPCVACDADAVLAAAGIR